MPYLFVMARKDLKKHKSSTMRAHVEPAIICGMDEVGRGPWAGPLVTCALILPPKHRIGGIKDSKKLTEAQREKVYKILVKKSYFGIGVASVKEVDKLGLIKATNLAFVRALKDMQSKKGSVNPDLLLVDGRDKLILPYPHQSIIRGDDKVKAISAASIVAKVTRDRMMKELAVRYPEYGFEEHKGYGTARHQRALKQHGPCVLHRTSFSPVNAVIKNFSSQKKFAKTSHARGLLLS